MRILDLYCKAGGAGMGYHWAGFKTIAFCEIDKFCQRVLRKNFPNIPIYDDITTFDGKPFRGVGLLSGGSPCQDISNANSRAQGVDGSRSRLIFEFLRVASEAKPLGIVIENSPRLLDRGYDRVEGELRSLGYQVAPIVLEAGDVGANQERERLFIVALLDKMGGRKMLESRFSNDLPGNSRGSVAKTEPGRQNVVLRADSNDFTAIQPDGKVISAPVFCGGVHGISNRLDRLRALGNAVDPYQAYPILKVVAELIAEAEEQGEVAS